MSSDPKGLHNLDFLPRYEKILTENLPESFTQFADFFAGTQRLLSLAAMLDDHVTGLGHQVLNVGSGPFATEIFVQALDGQNIVSLDYTPEFAPFHALFRAEGHLSQTRFKQADIMQEVFEAEAYDLIVLHDILYEHALDLEAVISRLLPSLKPGGLLFLDFVNSRTGWIWALFGRGNKFKRYDPADVRAFLHRNGLDIVEWRPTHGAKSLSARAIHAFLKIFGASNNYAVLARKSAS